MKESTENLIKTGFLTIYYTGVSLMIVGMVKFGIETVVENLQAKKAAKEKAAAE